MKTRITFGFLMLLFSGFLTYARILIVNNTPGAPTGYNYFTTIQAAHDNAGSGDTIYVIGSSSAYAGFNVSKKLVMIGPGYFLTENPETQANPNSATVSGDINFYSGSSGSVLTGITLIGGNTITIQASNITLKRNKLSVGNSSCIDLDSNIGNIIIVQNYMTAQGNYAAIKLINSNIQNVLISNNFIEQTSSGGKAIEISSSSSVIIKNNIIKGNLVAYNSNIQNNIMREGTFTGANNIILNNIDNSTQFGSSNGNQSNVNIPNLFIGTGSTDGQWQLKQGSLAIGAGVDGIDCGMFGGVTPYVLSGLPSIPAIYFFDAPTSGSNAKGLPIHIKVKSHN